MKKYDLIVIGTGSAGGNAAYGTRAKGWDVAIIDELPFGGTCALRGCDPKKILVGAAEIVDRSKAMEGKGIKKAPTINWTDLIKFKNEFTDNHNKGSEQGYKKAGIDSYHGNAVFTGKNTIKIGNEELQAKKFVIAVGDKPVGLGIKGEKHLTYSDGFLELNKLPKDITFIGGGYISFELAHIAARSGATVRILHRSSNPLKNFDQDLVGMLIEEFKEIGLEVILNAPVDGIEKKGNKYHVSVNNLVYKTDLVVHGAGRVPNVDDLGLDKALVDYDKNGVDVNDYLQTSNTNIYAGGDCAKIGMHLTPIAALHGKLIAKNLLKGNKKKVEEAATASAVFTYPILAAVGLTEEQAKKQGLKYDVKFEDTASWYNSKRIGLKHSGYKILIGKNDLIIGAHLLYPTADDVINIFTLAMNNKITSTQLKKQLWAYPSNSYDIKYML